MKKIGLLAVVAISLLSTNAFANESACSEAFRACLNDAKNASDKKQCAMDKKACQGEVKYDKPPIGGHKAPMGTRG